MFFFYFFISMLTSMYSLSSYESDSSDSGKISNIKKAYDKKNDFDIAEKLYKIIDEDNSPVRSNSGCLVYPHLKNDFLTSIAKRKLNNGFLPISFKAQGQIVHALFGKFETQDQAKKYFKQFSEEYELYDISIQRIMILLTKKYEESQKLNIARCMSSKLLKKSLLSLQKPTVHDDISEDKDTFVLPKSIESITADILNNLKNNT